MIKIDKDVPYPMHYIRRSELTVKYPFREMQIGDSFFSETTRKSMSSSIGQATKRTEFRFSIRTVTENGVTGVRVWRIS